MEGRTLDLHKQDVSQRRHPVYSGLTSHTLPIAPLIKFALQKLACQFSKRKDWTVQAFPFPQFQVEPCSSEQFGQFDARYGF